MVLYATSLGELITAAADADDATAPLVVHVGGQKSHIFTVLSIEAVANMPDILQLKLSAEVVCSCAWKEN
jgi:hypothetical protein